MERYVIHVTKECNMDCLYCYEKDKTSIYTWGEVKQLIDNIVKHATNTCFGVEFLGGEPLLAWDLIRKSYEYLEGNPDVSVAEYVLTTNGTVLTDEIADYISKNPKMRWVASMDGHVHANQLRVMKVSRKNSHDIVLENLKKLRNKYGVEGSIHMVTHPYNVAYIADSIDHLYKRGIRSIDVGTVESTIKIDETYCKRFIKELDIVSQKVVDGTYHGLRIGLFEWLKPKSDIRSYIKDPETGKVLGESYGRSGKDITHTGTYNTTRCTEQDEIAEMIYNIRKTAYNNHQKRLEGVKSNDN